MKNVIKIGICMLLAVLFLSFQAIEAKAYNANINYNIADNVTVANTIDTANGAAVHLDRFLEINGASFNDYDGSLLSGSYEATFIGYRAAHTNLLVDTNGSEWFRTGSPMASTTHSAAGDTATIFADTTKFVDIDRNPDLEVVLGYTDGALQYYKLDSNWTYTGTVGTSLDFLAGDIIVGFNDDGSHTDHLDLVVALRPSNVPIPGAIWLLGSGLLGLVGIRRRNS